MTYDLNIRGQSNEWTISSLTVDHISSLFKMIANSSVMNMKSLHLNLYASDISYTPPELVSEVVAKLEEFDFLGSLKTAQISAVFNGLSVVEDLKLRYLSIEESDISSVPTNILVKVISCLEKVYLAWTNLTTQQLTGIYRTPPGWWLDLITGKFLFFSPNLVWLAIALLEYTIFPYDLQAAQSLTELHWVYKRWGAGETNSD